MTFSELEETRKKYRKKKIVGFLIITIIIAGAVWLSISLNTFSTFGKYVTYFILLLCVIVLVLIATLYWEKEYQEYRRAYKEFFVVKSLEKHFSGLKYIPNGGMPKQIIAGTNMMNMGDIYNSEDYIQGEYKNVRFCQADVHLEEKYQSTDSDGHTSTSYETIFKGRWMVFDFNKSFKTNVQVAQKGFGNNRVRKKGLFSKKDDNSYFKKVSLESKDFNKRFDTYAQDEHDAFYIITPKMIERLIKLDNDNEGKLLFCFVGNRLHIGIYDEEDSFEPPNCLREIDIITEVDKISKDIKLITQFVDELSLDNDLFKS